MSIKCLFDAVERREDIGRRIAALVLPISNRPRVTSCCAGKLRLREPREHASGPNLASRDNVAHDQNYIRFWKRRHRRRRHEREPRTDISQVELQLHVLRVAPRRSLHQLRRKDRGAHPRVWPARTRGSPLLGACREAIELYFSTPPERWRVSVT
jgi:hypothetical protein